MVKQKAPAETVKGKEAVINEDGFQSPTKTGNMRTNGMPMRVETSNYYKALREQDT